MEVGIKNATCIFYNAGPAELPRVRKIHMESLKDFLRSQGKSTAFEIAPLWVAADNLSAKAHKTLSVFEYGIQHDFIGSLLVGGSKFDVFVETLFSLVSSYGLQVIDRSDDGSDLQRYIAQYLHPEIPSVDMAHQAKLIRNHHLYNNRP